MHPIQKRILEEAQKRELGQLTLREIGQVVGEEHPQKVKHHLNQLIKKNLIKIDPQNKTITPVKLGEIDSNDLISIPIYGSANCGVATLIAEEKLEGILKVSKSLLDYVSKSLFAVKAVGNSLNKANIKGKSIQDGDFVIIDSEKRNPQNNEYVLSIIDGMANIKKFVKDSINRQIILISESSQELAPIYIHENDMNSYMINGKVVQVIKNPKNI
jgi:repressor LexA